MRRTELKRSAISLGILLASYWVYATWIVPAIEPPVRQRAESVSQLTSDRPSAVERYRDELEVLFPEDAWETKSPKVLQSRNTLLLFQDYQPQDDGSIKIFPCTVVIRDEDAAHDSTDGSNSLILQAPEGAVLQLSRPIDLRGAQLGQPVAGRLLGRIQIRSPGKADGSGRLNVVTSNVQINPQRLWTPNDVEIEFERSHGQGRDLMIKLLPLQPNGKLARARGWAGIRSIELVHLHHLHLEIEPETPAEASSPDPAAPTSTPVDVACRGPLRADFIENVLTFEDEVKLERTDATGQVDTLRCERLSLQIQPIRSLKSESAGGPPGQTASATRRSEGEPAGGEPARGLGKLPRLELQRVIAEGDPVVLDAASRFVHLRGRKMLYDLKAGRFRLWADSDDATDQVHLRYRTQELSAREVDGEVAQRGGLQRVRAEGPGVLRGELSGNQPQTIVATWQRVLLFEPDEDELRHLTLAEAASVQVGASYAIEAETLHLWLEPAPEAGGPVTANDRDPNAQFNLRPHRVIALAGKDGSPTRPVRLSSAEINGTTQRLEARFTHVEAEARTDRPAVPARQVASSRSAPLSRTGRPLAEPAAATRQTRVQGESLLVEFQVQGKQLAVQSLVLQDQVLIEQSASDRPGEASFRLDADAVRMTGIENSQQYAVMASGQPVQIQSDKLKFLTTELQLNQAQNLVWTEKPGRMIVLVDRDANNQPLAQPQQMTIDWYRRMDFDGLHARFAGQVEVRGPEQRLRGEELGVQLYHKLAFGQTNTRGMPPVDIRHVRAQGNVILETREYDRGQLTAMTYLQVPYAQINRETGDLRCGGPGRVVTVREGFRGNLDLNQSPLTGAGSAGATSRTGTGTGSGSGERTFLQIDFQRQIEGNIERRIVDFEDRVQVIYGPVLSWNETLRPDTPLRKNDVLLSCDRLTVAQGTLPTPGPVSMDMIAQGNAYVEGQAFTARGDRVSYEQSKDQLVLEGTGHTDAVLSHHARVGAPRPEIEARKILFWPRSGRVEVDDARYLDLSNLGL